MFLSPCIRLKPLAQLCHRLAISTKAGVQDRKIWSSEAEKGSKTQQRAIALVSQELENRKSLTDALTATGKYFPPLFRKMVEVGETSGQLDQTYERLAAHYDRSLKSKRSFLGQLAWPLMQLVLALFVIGILIWVMGFLPANRQPSENSIDILGFGLVGNTGLFLYSNALILSAIFVLLTIEAARRGVGWSKSLQRFAIKLPVIGGALKTIAISRFTWALQLVLDTPMDLRIALPLALETTGNDYFSRYGIQVAEGIEHGKTIHSVLKGTGLFPTDLLNSIAVGEQGGRLVETLEHVSADYQQRAQSATTILAQTAGYGVWILIGAFIISMIFRLFSFYTGQINQFL